MCFCCGLQQVAIVTQIRNFVDTHQVVCAGPFVYAYVEEVSSHDITAGSHDCIMLMCSTQFPHSLPSISHACTVCIKLLLYIYHRCTYCQ